MRLLAFIQGKLASINTDISADNARMYQCNTTRAFCHFTKLSGDNKEEIVPNQQAKKRKVGRENVFYSQPDVFFLFLPLTGETDGDTKIPSGFKPEGFRRNAVFSFGILLAGDGDAECRVAAFALGFMVSPSCPFVTVGCAVIILVVKRAR